MSTSQTLELLKDALNKANGSPALAKGFTQSLSATTGLTAYDLEAPAKTLFPVITPLRNKTPRVSGNGGIQANWRAITRINTGNVAAGVSEGQRGGIIATEVKEYLAAYKGLGLEDFVTFEAEYAGKGFDDVKARATQNLLRALMIQEEGIILGGNGTLALGTTPTPNLVASASGGTIGATVTVSVIAVALTLAGVQNNSVANGLVPEIVRTNADGTQDTYGNGVAQKSAAATVATSGGTTNSVTASVTPVPGAFGYAWYAGTAGNERLFAITTTSFTTITSLPGATQLASAVPAADKSVNSLVYDGFLSLILKPGANGYHRAMAAGNTGLTADESGGIEEFDTALQHFWDEYKLSPSTIWVSSQEMNFIRKKVLAGGNGAAQRFVFQVGQQGLVGGTAIQGYTNPFTMGEAETLPIRIHPNLPAGTVFFDTDTLPYPLSGVTNVSQIRTRQEYYSLEFPLRTRKYEYGVYADEVLQCYAPFAYGLITGIAKG